MEMVVIFGQISILVLLVDIYFHKMNMYVCLLKNLEFIGITNKCLSTVFLNLALIRNHRLIYLIHPINKWISILITFKWRL